jgi:uncharacterized protein (UPF0335 family)
MGEQAKTCILHIGAPKTGSTALQKFLTENREALTRLGWEYPDVSLRGYGHHDFAFLLSGGYPEWATPQERPLEDLLAEMITTVVDKPRIILSSENFYLLSNPQDVADMLKEAGFDSRAVRVIVYVRRQDDVHESWYNQAVKAQGYTGTIKECITETHALWDYAAHLATWAEVFGHENLVVRPYQIVDLEEGDVCRDFLKLVGLDTGAFRCPAEIPNTRINRDVLEFQRLLNRLPLSPQEKRQFHKQLMALTAATANTGLFDDTPMLDTAERHAILSEYAEGNARVAREYIGRDRLFDEDVPTEAAPPNSHEGLSSEKLACILGWLLAQRRE